MTKLVGLGHHVLRSILISILNFEPIIEVTPFEKWSTEFHMLNQKYRLHVDICFKLRCMQLKRIARKYNSIRQAHDACGFLFVMYMYVFVCLDVDAFCFLKQESLTQMRWWFSSLLLHFDLICLICMWFCIQTVCSGK